MNRKSFIKSCTYTCIGFAGMSLLPFSCAPIRYVEARSENQMVRISKSEFFDQQRKHVKSRAYIILKTNDINYPIIIYRSSDHEYKAILLRCTHQGTELNVNGNLLSCPAHGSEFGNHGEVLQGPAAEPLKSFKVTNDQNHILIHLV